MRRCRTESGDLTSWVSCNMSSVRPDLDISPDVKSHNGRMRRNTCNESSFRTSCVILTVFTSVAFATCANGIRVQTAFVNPFSRKQNFRGIGGEMISASQTYFGQGNRLSTNRAFFGSTQHINPTILQMASSDTETATSQPRGRPKANAESSGDDESEWRTILAAFQMYKAAYGDLKVPSRFIVPGMAPWPGEQLFVVFSW